MYKLAILNQENIESFQTSGKVNFVIRCCRYKAANSL